MNTIIEVFVESGIEPVDPQIPIWGEIERLILMRSPVREYYITPEDAVAAT